MSFAAVAAVATGATRADAATAPARSEPGCQSTSEAPASQSAYIVTDTNGSPADFLGCRQIGPSLSLINGMVVSLPPQLAASLASIPGLSVTLDSPVSVQSTTVSTGPHTPSDAFLQDTGATSLAAAGDTGQGVTVAVVDTGIANLPDFAGRLIAGPDFTGEGSSLQDDYGHGTFVAGLIAGDGASSDGQYRGEAPGADLVSIKVAGASGRTDLATVIRGIGWVIGHQKQLGIKVLNLSLGYQPLVSTLNDPLDRAVEAAWKAGITVVTSAGNAGPFNGTILSPGDDPLAITAGSLDDMATTDISDDEMTDFSSAGPTSPDGWVKPDLVTSGRSVVSLTAPGSTVWSQNPSARLGADDFVGSGTSFSAAITSGAAALVLALNPGIGPNQVKGRLLGTAAPGPVGNPLVDGHGALDAAAAATGPALSLDQSVAGVAPTPVGATVSLAPTGPADSWNAALWSGAAWNGVAWNGAAWNGVAWNGAAWNGVAWNGAAWNSAAWNGAAWNGVAWNGSAWNGAAWNGAAWNGAAWNGAAWNGAAWNGAAWNGAAWN